VLIDGIEAALDGEGELGRCLRGLTQQPCQPCHGIRGTSIREPIRGRPEVR
jgi:hypothetical protein